MGIFMQNFIFFICLNLWIQGNFEFICMGSFSENSKEEEGVLSLNDG